MESMSEEKMITEINRLKKELKYFYVQISLAIGLILFLVGFGGTMLFIIAEPNRFELSIENSSGVFSLIIMLFGLFWLILGAIIEKTKYEQIHQLKVELKLLRAKKHI